jgi:hypothetical protein
VTEGSFAGSPSLSTPRPTKEDSQLASSGKRKTTMAKLNRERRLLERRAEKQVKKDARKRAALESDGPTDTVSSADHLTIVNQLAGADGLSRADQGP